MNYESAVVAVERDTENKSLKGDDYDWIHKLAFSLRREGAGALYV